MPKKMHFSIAGLLGLTIVSALFLSGVFSEKEQPQLTQVVSATSAAIERVDQGITGVKKKLAGASAAEDRSAEKAEAMPDAAKDFLEGEEVFQAKYGGQEDQLGIEPDGFGIGPLAFSFLPNGQLLFLDQENKRIAVQDGESLRSLIKIPQGYIKGLSADGNGHIYVLMGDSTYVLHKYTEAGELVEKTPLPDVPVRHQNAAYVMVKEPFLYIVAQDRTYQLFHKKLVRTVSGVPLGESDLYVDAFKVDDRKFGVVFRDGHSAPVETFFIERNHASVEAIFTDAQERIYLIFESDPYANDYNRSNPHFVVEVFRRDGTKITDRKIRMDDEYHADVRIFVNQQGELFQMIPGATSVQVKKYQL